MGKESYYMGSVSILCNQGSTSKSIIWGVRDAILSLSQSFVIKVVLLNSLFASTCPLFQRTYKINLAVNSFICNNLSPFN